MTRRARKQRGGEAEREGVVRPRPSCAGSSARLPFRRFHERAFCLELFAWLARTDVLASFELPNTSYRRRHRPRSWKEIVIRTAVRTTGDRPTLVVDRKSTRLNSSH